MTKELHEKLVAWRKMVGAKMPTANVVGADDSDQSKQKKKGNRKKGRRAA